MYNVLWIKSFNPIFSFFSEKKKFVFFGTGKLERLKTGPTLASNLAVHMDGFVGDVVEPVDEPDERGV